MFQVTEFVVICYSSHKKLTQFHFLMAEFNFAEFISIILYPKPLWSQVFFHSFGLEKAGVCVPPIVLWVWEIFRGLKIRDIAVPS